MEERTETETIPFENERGPFPYDLLSLNDPYARDTFQKSLDPDLKINKFSIDYIDPNIRSFYAKHIFKDLESSKNIYALYYRLLALHQRLKRTESLRDLGITFEPNGEDGSLKLVLKPAHASRFEYKFTNAEVNNSSFGVSGSVKVRNITGMLDNLTLKGTLGYYGNMKNGIVLSYNLPLLYRQCGLSLMFGRENNLLNRSTTEGKSYQVIKFTRGKVNLALSYMTRWNTIDPIYHSKSSLDGDLDPARKVALYIDKSWSGILRPRKIGNVFKAYASLAHVENAGKHMKFGFYDYIICDGKSLGLQGKLGSLGFENHFSGGLVFPLFGSKLKMNDRFFRTNMPGFEEIVNPETNYDRTLHPFAGNKGYEYLGEHRGDDVWFRNTFKINFRYCPLLSDVGLQPFIYGSYAYFSGNLGNTRASTHERKRGKVILDELAAKGRYSVGVGIRRKLASSVNVDGLVNLFTVGRPGDNIARFQLRFAFSE